MSERSVYQLIYASAATRDITAEDIKQILRSARRNNAWRRITGMLLYHDGAFLQVLEGPKPVVEMLYKRISKDPRHDNKMVLLRSWTSAREFSEWTMGFQEVDGVEAALSGLNTFLETGHGDVVAAGGEGEDDEEMGGAALRVLRGFRDGKWHRELR